jgi:hypothetical protein
MSEREELARKILEIQVPESDADLSPELARSIILKYREAIAILGQPPAPVQVTGDIYLAARELLDDLKASYSNNVARDKRAALEAALQSGVPSVWLPIETAPKDGTSILVYHPDHGWDVAQWQDGEESAPDDPRPDAGWMGFHTFPGCADFGFEAHAVPTHWKPLDTPYSAAAPAPGEGR